MRAYLVAEIGQNHQGSVQVAKDLIRVCADPARGDLYGDHTGGVDAVKLTRRDLDHELAAGAAARRYTGDRAFGATYGQHRAALELSDAEHAECYAYAKHKGLDFVMTVCAPGALSLLNRFQPDALKVASRDLTNHALLHAIADAGLPVILSTGMSGPDELDAALDIVGPHVDDVTILHCLSQYPADSAALNLRTIQWLRDHYPSQRIGYSDHSVGVWAPVAAVALGAEAVEKHVTLDRRMRGSDHPGALERDGIYRWVRNTRELERALGRYGMERSPASDAARRKLARSVATRTRITRGTVITTDEIEPLSPGTGIPWPERHTVVGSVATEDVEPQTLLTATMVAESATNTATGGGKT